MPGKQSTFENDWLKLIFNAVTITGVARDDATPITTLTVALHTGDPGDAGTQATNETTYTNYVRKTVARTTGGWVVTGSSVSPAADIDFAECGATPGTAIQYFSVGTGVSNKMLYFGPVTPNITMSAGVIPRLKSTSTIQEA